MLANWAIRLSNLVDPTVIKTDFVIRSSLISNNDVGRRLRQQRRRRWTRRANK